MRKAITLMHPCMPGVDLRAVAGDRYVLEAARIWIAVESYGLIPKPTFHELKRLSQVVAYCLDTYPLDLSHPDNETSYMTPDEMWAINLLHLGIAMWDKVMASVWPGIDGRYQPHKLRPDRGNRGLVARVLRPASYPKEDLPIRLVGEAELSAAHRSLLNQAVAWANRIRLCEMYGQSMMHSPQELLMMAGGITAAAEALAEAYPVQLLHAGNRVVGTTFAQAWRLAIQSLAGQHERLPGWPHPDYTGHRNSYRRLLMQRRPAITGWVAGFMLQRRQGA